MWVGLLPVFLAFWVVLLDYTSAYQVFRYRPQEPTYNAYSSQQQSYPQTMNSYNRRQQYNYNNNNRRQDVSYSRSYTQRPAQSVQPTTKQNQRAQNVTSSWEARRRRRYNLMMARRRLAALRYKFRSETCDPTWSLYCRCSRRDCNEFETQAFVCGVMWTGRRCCQNWWTAHCMVKELMGNGNSRGGGRGQRRSSMLTNAMLAPMMFETLEI